MRLSRELRRDYQQHEMRAYGRKNGFVTKGQSQRLQKYLPGLAVPSESRLGEASFCHAGPVVMEIGFGNGEFLDYLACKHTEWNLIGVEIYLPGVAKAVSRLEAAAVLDRVLISQNPAQFVLAHQVPGGYLHGIYINHPDPWPKARHAKRRLIQPQMARLLASRLESGGFLKLATDWPELAEWMRTILDATPGLKNMAGANGYVARGSDRPVSKFEQRGMREGRESLFLHYQRME